MTKRRRYRRTPAQYPKALSVVLTADMKAQVEAEADRLDISVNEIVRRCIEIGLPALRQTERKPE